MAYCKICGEENRLTPVLRFWSPDDGWVAGRLCQSCKRDHGSRLPSLGDYAYDTKKMMFTDVDDAVNAIYG